MAAIYLYGILTGWRYAYINYKGMFHINPYPEGFFHDTMNEELAEKKWEELNIGFTMAIKYQAVRQQSQAVGRQSQAVGLQSLQFGTTVSPVWDDSFSGLGLKSHIMKQLWNYC